MNIKINMVNHVYTFLNNEKVQKDSRFWFHFIQHYYMVEYSKNKLLNGFNIDKSLQAAEKQASNQMSRQNLEFDENVFQQFMSKNPMWDYHCMTQEEYLQKTKPEMEQLLSTYYVQMKNGEKH